MKQVPKISIVTPSLNQGCFISECIESVLKQNDPRFEHIIMDGGSSDDTIQILKKYSHLIWRSEKDEGQSDAVNKALSLATGDIVGWINADDFYYPGSFAIVRQMFDEDPTLDIVTGDYCFVDASGHLLRKRKELGFDYRVYLYAGKSYLGNASAFFRKRILDQHGGPRKDLHHSMDYELFVRLVKVAKFKHVRQFLASYRLHSQSKTTLDLNRGIRETKALQLEFISKELGKRLSSLPLSVRFKGIRCMIRRVAQKYVANCYR